jgi:DNA polymerase III subunit epsilon
MDDASLSPGRVATPLRELDVVVVDCQASGATPVLGAVLELGWAIAGPRGFAAPIEASWVAPPEGTRVSRPVRELTGWSEDCLAAAVSPEQAWSRLLGAITARGTVPAPCVIHFARFERGFLEDLHQRYGQGPFPLDTVCLHEVARRLFPELPRRNLRALAGYLGHSPQLVRRSAGHVDASAFIWKAVLPALALAGVHSWDDLKGWVGGKAPPRARRTYPLLPERRRALPECPGVYRLLRPNGDVLYVGKAANLKKRIAGHFTRTAHPTERGLEMLTQVHTVDVTSAATTLEAALLEADEIKRLHPPYNVQLRDDDGRQVWFARADLADAAPEPGDAHRVGPLPSRWALASLAAIRALATGGDLADARARAAAVGVPPPFAPEAGIFLRAWDDFCAQHVGAGAGAKRVWHALLRAARRLELTGVAEGGEDSPLAGGVEGWGWDLDRVRRHLDRGLLRGGQLVRRARWLVLLSEASLVFREPDGDSFRLLVVERGRIREQRDIVDPLELPARGAPPPWRVRQAAIDAAGYDRLRVLATELARIRTDGGSVLVGIGERRLTEPGAGGLIGGARGV